MRFTVVILWNDQICTLYIHPNYIHVHSNIYIKKKKQINENDCECLQIPSEE